MKLAELEITLTAQDDIREIKNYISNVLNNPQAAIKLIKEIQSDLNTLRGFPKSNRIRDELPELKERSYRILHVKSFFVYYRFVEEVNTIFVETVIYDKREIRKELFNFE